jgi:hypothetical protein
MTPSCFQVCLEVRKEVYGIFWSSSSGSEAVCCVIAWRFPSLHIHMTSKVIRTCPYVTTDSLNHNSHSYNPVLNNLKWHFIRETALFLGKERLYLPFTFRSCWYQSSSQKHYRFQYTLCFVYTNKCRCALASNEICNNLNISDNHFFNINAMVNLVKSIVALFCYIQCYKMKLVLCGRISFIHVFLLYVCTVFFYFYLFDCTDSVVDPL